MLAFGLSIFLSAFLLFTVQPLMAKKLLPWFGGSPAVWLSIVLFFQSILLLGYLYAYALTKIKRLQTQIIVHGLLILGSLLFVPIIPAETGVLFEAWPPVGIFCLLLSTLCLPAVLLSASSPLLQFWFTTCYQTDYPYRYYSLSNAGSLLGLLAFPFLLEPLLGLSIQLYLWSFLFAAYLLGLCSCLFLVYKKGKLNIQKSSTQPVNKSALLSWIALTFLSSALLLTTTQVTLQNVAGFPLLWVLPLSLYLISFILTFAYPSLYKREIWAGLFALVSATLFYYPSHHKLSLILQIALYASMLFTGCMVCHGELIRLKPHQSRLTTYYLMIALGGVLGGIFINLAAPLLFNQWWDFYACVFGILLLAAIYFFHSENAKNTPLIIKGIWGAAYIGLGVLLGIHINTINQDVILNHRNFFGSVEVVERFPHDPSFRYRTLTNGSILHGKQFYSPEKRNQATSYYSADSGIGLGIQFQRQLAQKSEQRGISIGVIGLGTGTIAALTQFQDQLRFYEIDPDIEKLAKDYFFYLQDAKAKVDVIIGDGRLKLEEELAKNGSHQFNILAIDAFNGDAIPVHLLTLEALNIYLSHLAPGGILAFHVSSRYVDLYPALQQLATQLQLFSFTTHNSENFQEGIFSSQWVLLTRASDLGAFLYINHSLLFPPERMSPIWTDDHNYLLSVIRW